MKASPNTSLKKQIPISPISQLIIEAASEAPFSKVSSTLQQLNDAGIKHVSFQSKKVKK